MSYEQAVKQVAIGRKNWLFIGSIPAGMRAADIMTLVSSALRNDLHVWAYVKGVLDALLAGATDYASLRPDVWARNHPEHIRTYLPSQRTSRPSRQKATSQRLPKNATQCPEKMTRKDIWHSCTLTCRQQLEYFEHAESSLR